MSTPKLNTVCYEDAIVNNAVFGIQEADAIVAEFLNVFKGDVSVYDAVDRAVQNVLDDLCSADLWDLIRYLDWNYSKQLTEHTDVRIGEEQSPALAIQYAAYDVYRDVFWSKASHLVLRFVFSHCVDDTTESVPVAEWECLKKMVDSYGKNDILDVKADALTQRINDILSVSRAKLPRNEMYDELTKLQSVIYPPDVGNDDPEYDEWESGEIEFRFVTKSGKVTASAKIWTHAAYVECIDCFIDELKEIIVEEEGDEFDYT